MRLADTPTMEVAEEVDAPPEVLWPLITDIRLPARFSNEFQGAEWIDGATGPALGATFRGNNEQFGSRWSTLCTVVACEEPSVFGWRVNESVATWTFTVTPAGAGSRLVFRAEMGPGPSGITAMISSEPDREDKIIEQRLRMWEADMAATVRGIKNVAEAAGS